jgi:hypothetical protein
MYSFVLNSRPKVEPVSDLIFPYYIRRFSSNDTWQYYHNDEMNGDKLIKDQNFEAAFHCFLDAYNKRLSGIDIYGAEKNHIYYMTHSVFNRLTNTYYKLPRYIKINYSNTMNDIYRLNADLINLFYRL